MDIRKLRNLLPTKKTVKPLTTREILALENRLKNFPIQLKTYTGELDPEMAALFIGALRLPNRVPNWSRVISYASAMQRGEWELTGEAIKIVKKGIDEYVLGDGQKRCLAVMLSGVTVVTQFIIDLADDAVPFMDKQEVRTFVHDLQFADEERSNKLSPAVKLLWRWENGLLVNDRAKPSTVQGIDTLLKHPGIRERVAEMAQYTGTGALLPSGPAIFLAYVLGRIDEEKMKDFLGRVKDGIDIQSKTDPVYALRRKLQLMRNRMNCYRAQDWCRIIVYTIRAWNLYVQNKRTNGLGSWDGKTIPDIIGYH